MAEIDAREIIEGVAEESAVTERPQTETLDRLYLEWSQFTGARTGREMEMQRENQGLRRLLSNWLAWYETGEEEAPEDLHIETLEILRPDSAADAPSRTAT